MQDYIFASHTFFGRHVCVNSFTHKTVEMCQNKLKTRFTHKTVKNKLKTHVTPIQGTAD